MPPRQPHDLDQALAGKVLLAGWHQAEVEELVRRHYVDVVVADGFRLGAGLAAERLGLPWVAYTHHYFDEARTSEGMVEYYCQVLRECTGTKGRLLQLLADAA